MLLVLPVGDMKWIYNNKPKPEHTGKEDVTIRVRTIPRYYSYVNHMMITWQVPATVRGAILGLSSLSLLPDKKMRKFQPYHGALVITFNRSGLALGLARLFKRVGQLKG